MAVSFRWNCCCGDYMDSGCYFPTLAQTYPVNCYIDQKIIYHLSTGDVVKARNYVFLPGSENGLTLCNWKLTKTDGLSTYLDGSAKYYKSPVQIDSTVGQSILPSIAPLAEGNQPSYRWTGYSRLWAQARQGIGKALKLPDPETLFAPDTEGLLISDDFWFYKATLTGPTVTITPLIAEDSTCMVEGLRAGTISDVEYNKVLAHVLARLIVDPDREPYSAGDISFAEGKSSHGYGWHWSYTGNECSKVIIDNREIMTHLWALNSLVRVDFEFTTDEYGVETVAATLVVEDSEKRFKPYPADIFWTRRHYLGQEILYAQIGEVTSNVYWGEGTPMYVFYRHGGTRSVLRYTFEEDDAGSTPADEFPQGGSRTCEDHLYNEGRFSANQKLLGGTWALDDTEVSSRRWGGLITWQTITWDFPLEGGDGESAFLMPSIEGECSGTIVGVVDERVKAGFNTIRHRSYGYKQLELLQYYESDSVSVVIQSSNNPDALYLGARKKKTTTYEAFSHYKGFSAWRYYTGGPATLFAYAGAGELYNENVLNSGNEEVEPPWSDNDPPDEDEMIIMGSGAVFVSEQGVPDSTLEHLFDITYARTVGESPALLIAMESFNGTSRWNTNGAYEFAGNEVTWSGLHENRLMRYCGWA